jgi:hypothetical protein
MTDGILVWVQERRGGTPLLSLKYPLDHERAEEACDLQEINNQLLSQMKGGQLEPDVVMQVGTSLAECLLKHDAIKFELQRVLDKKGAIYLRLDAPVADDLPWEALHTDKSGFLAFDERWPIARVKNVRRPLKAVEPFVPPLKIFALLAPTGPNVPANDEWQSLYEALKESNLNVKLRVLVCDDELKAQIDQAAATDKWIECAFVPDQAGLFDQIASFSPQIIHFFCHGKASSPPFLQAGNRIDFKRNQAGTVTIEATQLRQRADPNQSVWLTTLDCCETAAQVNDGTSRSRAFASSLVLEGVPAVIGMREPLDQAVATRFCKLFYSRLLANLRQKFTAARKSGKEVEIEWTAPLFAARQELCQLVDSQRPFSVVARAAKDWTIPVLYTRPEPFVVTVAADPAETCPIDRPAAQPAPPIPPQPAPAGPAINGNAAMSLSRKIEITSEIQQLSIQRSQLGGATAIPENVRASILGEIDARIAQLQKELGI